MCRTSPSTDNSTGGTDHATTWSGERSLSFRTNSWRWYRSHDSSSSRGSKLGSGASHDEKSTPASIPIVMRQPYARTGIAVSVDSPATEVATSEPDQ